MMLAALLATLFLPAQSAPAEASPVLALRGARVIPVSAPPVDNAVVLIRNGRLAAVGKDVAVPEGAVVLDLPGRVVVPGFIDAASRVLLHADEGAPGAADQRVLDALDRNEPAWREARARGVTAVFLSPPGSGLVSGVGAVVSLDDEGTVLLPEAALRFSLASGKTTSPAQRHELLRQVRALFEGVRQFRESLEKHAKDLAEHAEKKKAAEGKKEPFRQAEPPKPKSDRKTATILKALDPAGTMRVRVEAHWPDSIEGLLALAAEFKFRLVLEEATHAAAGGESLAKAGVPVVLAPAIRYAPGEVDRPAGAPGPAAALSKAGVALAIGSCPAGVSGGPTRFLREFAGLACAAGLPEETSLAAITLEAARALGIDKEAGSIEAGKRADLVVLDGPLFGASTRVERVFVGGKIVHGGRE